MHCYIYRSEKKTNTYLYLDCPLEQAELADDLRVLFAPMVLAMELDLNEQTRLGREDISKVLENLEINGYHLQLPPAQDSLLI